MFPVTATSSTPLASFVSTIPASLLQLSTRVAPPVWAVSDQTRGLAGAATQNVAPASTP